MDLNTKKYNTHIQLSEYIRRISCFDRISGQKEKELAKIIANSTGSVKDNAIKELVEGNLFLVVSIATKKISSGIDIIDLISAGNLALFEAAKNYSGNHKSNASFSTLAHVYIKNAMFNARSRLVRLPDQFNLYANYIKRFEVKNNRPITIKEIAKVCKVSFARAREIKDGLDVRTFSVELLSPASENDTWVGGNWEDVVGDYDPSFTQMFLRLDLSKYIEQLKPEQRDIIRLYFDEALSDVEIGKKMGCSKQYISVLGQRAIRELKSKIMRDWDKLHKIHTKVISGKDIDRLRDFKKMSVVRKIIAAEDKINRPIYKEVLAHYLGKK